jgi:hypothetical protein
MTDVLPDFGIHSAEENEHMLSIKVQLGFKAAGYDGEWQKRIT